MEIKKGIFVDVVHTLLILDMSTVEKVLNLELVQKLIASGKKITIMSDEHPRVQEFALEQANLDAENTLPPGFDLSKWFPVVRKQDLRHYILEIVVDDDHWSNCEKYFTPEEYLEELNK